MGAAEAIVIAVVVVVAAAAILARTRAEGSLRTSTSVFIAVTLVAALLVLADVTSDEDNAGEGAGKVLLVWVVLGVLLLAYRGVTNRQEQQTVAVTARTPSGDVDALGKLADLHDRGVLNDQEFTAKKSELLNRSR